MKRTISAIVEILVFTIPIFIVNKSYPERFSDKEALVTRMFQSFRSQRLKFVFVFANEEVNNSGLPNETFKSSVDSGYK